MAQGDLLRFGHLWHLGVTNLKIGLSIATATLGEYAEASSCAQVWDRRALRGNRPAGVLIGHTEGITHLDSKNDGRYLLSNCKDQTARLWDIRKVLGSPLLTHPPLQVSVGPSGVAQHDVGIVICGKGAGTAHIQLLGRPEGHVIGIDAASQSRGLQEHLFAGSWLKSMVMLMSV